MIIAIRTFPAVAAACALLLWTVSTVVVADNNYNSYGGSSSSSSSSSSYYSSLYGANYYADTTNTYYDGYQQAWRYLGWYVDCNGGSSRYYQRSGHGGGKSGDNYMIGNNFCQRYLMWAAYVDENYSGGGIGEYSIFDTSKGYYDSTACNKHGNGNCKLMDCHDPYTQNWKLIGVFKEASFFGGDAFFEQLFKHEGTCLWNDEDTYEYMNTARQSWTSGCLSTGIQTGTKNQYGDDNLYIDLKPTYNGNMTYALYTDYVCSVEYEGYKYNVDAVAAKMGLLYGSYMQQWNDAMEVFKVCQPCRAYNLQTSSSSSSKYSSSSSWKKKYYNNRDLSSADEESERELGNNNNNGYSANSGWYADDDDSYDPNEGYFRCDDEADYSNVNQCMKFRSHGDLEAASWEDLVAATNQGGILQVSVNGIIYGSPFVSKEQDQYLTYVRRQKEAAYEQELQNKANKLIREAPTGENMFVIGLLWIGLGGLTLLLSTCRFVRQCRSWREIRSLSEPLHTEVIIVR